MGKYIFALFLVFSLAGRAQQFNGTWTGNFVRDGKTAPMQLELTTHSSGIVGIFTLLSDDNNKPAAVYVVRLEAQKGDKFLLRRVQYISRADKYENRLPQLPAQRRRASQRTEPNTAAAYSSAFYNRETESLMLMSTSRFVQFIGNYLLLNETENLAGNWYITEEGINSYTKPTGSFSVAKTSTGISARAATVIESIFKN
jgi:hypothetical protein